MNRISKEHCATRPVAACVCFAVCIGCGGSGGGPSTSPLEETTNATNRMVSDFTPIQYTDLNTLPTSGTANYQGYISAQLSNTSDDITDALRGELSVSVDFGSADIVSGTAQNFLDQDGAQLSGTLSLSDGVLDRTGDPVSDATFTFEATGDLTDSNGRILMVETAFEGDFLETNHTGIGGDLAGRVTVDGEDQSLGGFFIASQ